MLGWGLPQSSSLVAMGTVYPVDTPPLTLFDTFTVACGAKDGAMLRRLMDTVSLDTVELAFHRHSRRSGGFMTTRSLATHISAAVSAAPDASVDWLLSAAPRMIKNLEGLQQGSLDAHFVAATRAVIRYAALDAALKWIHMLGTVCCTYVVHREVAVRAWVMRPVPELALFRAIVDDPRMLDDAALWSAMCVVVKLFACPGPVANPGNRTAHDWSPLARVNMGTAAAALDSLLCHPDAPGTFADASVVCGCTETGMWRARSVFTNRGLFMVPTAEAADIFVAHCKEKHATSTAFEAVMGGAPDEAWTPGALAYIMTTPDSVDAGCQPGGFFVTNFPRGFPIGSGAMKRYAEILFSSCPDAFAPRPDLIEAYRIHTMEQNLGSGVFDQFLLLDTAAATEGVLRRHLRGELKRTPGAIAGIIAEAVKGARRRARARNAPAVLSVMAAADKVRVAQQAQPPTKRRRVDAEDRAATLAAVLTARRVCRHGADGRVVEPWGREVVGFFV